MEWIKVETYWDDDNNIYSNIYKSRILVTNGEWVEYIEFHGWDDKEYFFNDGTGKIKGVTHWMPLPEPPEINK